MKPFTKRYSSSISTVLLRTYARDIHDTDRQTEKLHSLSKLPSLSETQNEVNEHMRGVLVDWLIEVVEEFHLSHHVLLLGVDYLDRVLSVLKVPRESLQLIGITCLFIASKFDGEEGANLDDFVSVTDGLYTRDQARGAETLVLSTLGFRLVTSTIATFLPSYLIVAGLEKNEAKHYSKFLAEMLLPIYSILRKHVPSKLAASIVLITNRLFGSQRPLSTEFEDYTQYTEESLKECIQDIQKSLQNSEFLSAYQRYSQMKYDCVSAKHGSFS